eukprot:SAG25_NODE_9559_length_368_cov_0.546468_1_plen_41_part_10
MRVRGWQELLAAGQHARPLSAMGEPMSGCDGGAVLFVRPPL